MDSERNVAELSVGSSPTDDPNATVPSLPVPPFPTLVPAPPAEPLAESAAAELSSRRYHFLAPLGEGGMGVVYRAEDTHLGRTVAVKTIPAALTANRRAKERFLNEARVVSALDHPNVCTVYEIEETAEGRLRLFMPCYDGETLRSRLQRGPIPLWEAVRIAEQVASGLAKAHRKGIVHCDVKPANLMLTADGIVKVLDFGIARLSGQGAPAPAGPSGTPKYRSPEQARGEGLRPASDVWSLGLVVFEMLTGRLPPRDDEGRVVWDAEFRRLLKVPRDLAAVLWRMLAYRPADRYPDAGALLADLDRMEERNRGFAADLRAARRRQRLSMAGLGVMGVALALLGGARPANRQQRQPQAQVESTFLQLTDFAEKATFPNLSFDGSTVLYVRSVEGRSHIYSRPMSTGVDSDLSAGSPADDTQPAFSPDGRSIAFRSERSGGGLFLMDANGGAAHRLLGWGFHPAWSPDGKELLFSTANIVNPRMRPTSSAVFRLDVESGALRQLTQNDAAQPSWSPDGMRIAYWGVQPETGNRLIWTDSAEGGKATVVFNDGSVNWNPVWSPDGRFLYFVSDRSGIMNLWRIRIDEESGRAVGLPQSVNTSQQASISPSVSHDGRIVFASDGSTATIESVGFDPERGRLSDSPSLVVRTSGLISSCASSPDGRWLTYQVLSPREKLFIVHPDGSGRQSIVADEFKNRSPQFSSDSLRLAFYSNRSGHYEIWTTDLKGHPPVRETLIPGKTVSNPLWSPRGGMLACDVDGREALVDLTRPLENRLQFLPRPPYGASNFVAYSWSADGRWLAGVRVPQGGSPEPGIWRYSLADGKYDRLTDEGQGCLWLHDSRRLLYSVGDKIFLFDTRSDRSVLVVASSRFRDFSLSPDDRMLYFVRRSEEGQIWQLQLRDRPQ